MFMKCQCKRQNLFRFHEDQFAHHTTKMDIAFIFALAVLISSASSNDSMKVHLEGGVILSFDTDVHIDGRVLHPLDSTGAKLNTDVHIDGRVLHPLDSTGAKLTSWYCSLVGYECEADDIEPPQSTSMVSQCLGLCSGNPACFSAFYDENKICHLRKRRCAKADLKIRADGLDLTRLQRGESCSADKIKYVQFGSGYGKVNFGVGSGEEPTGANADGRILLPLDSSGSTLTTWYCAANGFECQTDDIVPPQFTSMVSQCLSLCSSNKTCFSAFYDEDKICHLRNKRCVLAELKSSANGLDLIRLQRGESCLSGDKAKHVLFGSGFGNVQFGAGTEGDDISGVKEFNVDGGVLMPFEEVKPVE